MAPEDHDDAESTDAGSTQRGKTKGYAEEQPQDREEARQPPADSAKPPDSDSGPAGKASR